MELYNTLIAVIKDCSDIEEISPESHLQNDLALDSLSMVTLLLGIEEAFGITLDESDMNPFQLATVQDAIDLVQKYTGDHHE